MLPTLATSKFCGPCLHLKKHLVAVGAEYKLVDMAENAEFFLKRGIKSVPCLIVDEKNIIYGAAEIAEWFESRDV